MAGREFYLWRTRAFAARIALDTINQMNAALFNPTGRTLKNDEQGGILLGRLTFGGVVEISGFELFPSEHRRGIAYDLGLRERTRLTAYVHRLRRGKGAIPIGCFRTHHRPGLFLDQDDFSVMKDAFADASCTALLIRPDPSGIPAAGFFFWENEDIDRTRTQLAFPFNSSLLRERGPVISVANPPARKTRRLVPAWQALTMAAFAALAGFGIVSAATRAADPQTPKVLVAMSVEPESTEAGIVPAQPSRPVAPRVPPAMAAQLSGDVPVDVRVSIDGHGVVRNAEVLNGSQSDFDSLAADNAAHTSWQPAHWGERTLPSESIVHYRFRPASAERR
ncbi:MAG: energy transducer TonB [Acidobacteriota bacterium]|nr:energy transducer TonB [Acidobacteriota bacterium]